MRNNQSRILLIVTAAIFTALNIVLTCFITIPIPNSQGYMNLSDAIILLVAGLINPVAGALTGAISASISDLILGYAIYAPYSFIIKGIEGLAVGYLLRFFAKRSYKIGLGLVFPIFFLGGALMMGGYFPAEWIIYGDPLVASGSLLFNFIQGTVNAAIAAVLFYSLYRLPALKFFGATANAHLFKK